MIVRETMIFIAASDYYIVFFVSLVYELSGLQQRRERERERVLRGSSFKFVDTITILTLII